MLSRTRSALWSLLVAITACSAAPTDPDIRRLEAPASTVQASPNPVEQALPFLSKIRLTAVQTKRIKAIIHKHWPTPDPAQAEQAAKAFQAVMLAPTVDTIRLHALLAKAEKAERKSSLALVAVLEEVRPLLTERERAKVAAAMLAPPKPASVSSPSPPEEQAPSLTDEQQVLFKASQAPHPAERAVTKAIARLLTHGDPKPLTKALKPHRSVADQVNATVAALASLTADQRQAMFASDQQNDAAG
ncbi:MAG: hypothetical protein JWM80_1027 [Cyanobacteria bacterium RYN_339]|nr:hypothetical protein [Cyanobacteria bacterium RYN_339]